MGTEKNVGEANNRFAFNIYKQANPHRGNFFVSPFSIRVALAMTYGGSRGNTATQIAKALELSGVGDSAHTELGGLIKDLTKSKGDIESLLSVANALWVEKGYPFLPTFLDLNKKYYDAGLEEMDFSKSEAARKKINDWVAKKTADKIQNLIPPKVLSGSTRLVLTNAVYFKAGWLHPFNKASTTDEKFSPSAGASFSTPFLYQNETFLYAETEDLQLIELPYRDRRTAMVVLLPKKKDGLASLESGINEKKLEELFTRTKRQKVKVYLPKFKFSSSLSASAALRQLGILDAFSRSKADFSAMTNSKETGEPLYISDVLHKTFVAVDEEGTEAAAATAVMMLAGGVPRDEPNPPIFRADHPFMFFIRHYESGAILFMGSVSNPKAAE